MSALCPRNISRRLYVSRGRCCADIVRTKCGHYAYIVRTLCGHISLGIYVRTISFFDFQLWWDHTSLDLFLMIQILKCFLSLLFWIILFWIHLDCSVHLMIDHQLFILGININNLPDLKSNCTFCLLKKKRVELSMFITLVSGQPFPTFISVCREHFSFLLPPPPVNR